MPRREAPDNLVEKAISRILDRCGVAGPMRATYHSFGRKVWSIAQKHGDQSSINDAIVHYQTYYGADPETLKIIIESLLKLNYT
jgi:hypothetical protein